jgi:hypothetical protein
MSKMVFTSRLIRRDVVPRIPLPVDMNIERFAGGTVSRYGSYVQNGVVDQQGKDPDIRTIVTQRPGIDLGINPDDEPVTDNRGRGIYYWDDDSARWLVNNDTVYVGSYATSVTPSATGPGGGISFTAGTERVYFAEVGSNLIITNPEDNEAKYYTTSNTEADLAAVTNFPSDIVHGAVELNDYLFVMNEAGSIFNSANGDVSTAWGASDFTAASREGDKGVFLGSHHDHLVAFKSGTIEFFYDAGNPSGSPLTRRPDIFYNIGCVNGNSVAQVGDLIYFVGTDARGGVGVYLLHNFKIKKISIHGLDSYLTSVLTVSTNGILGAGISAQGKSYYVITPHDASSDTDSYHTFCYDVSAQMWYVWTTAISSIDSNNNIPIVGSAPYRGTTPRTGEFISANGCVCSFTDILFPVDTEGVTLYVEEGYWGTEYTDDTPGTSSNVTMEVQTGMADHGVNSYKYALSVEYVGDVTQDADTATLSWSDDTHENYGNVTRSLNVAAKAKLKRLGRFLRRSWRLTYSGDEQIRAEALEVDVRRGIH